MDINSIKRNYDIVGKSIDLNRAIDIAVQVSSTEITTLIIGESGTGKENIPKIIHSLSNRRHENFISVNCGAIPEGTIDSELFGHVKGAFTGAHETRKGYFEVANKGTIFLDEVGELPISTQARLLRILENGEFIKVGSSEVSKTDVRIIAATNVNLSQAIKDGKFREDLYYRLSTVNIKLPPLRNRGEDIQLLFKKFAVDFADKYKTDPIKLDTEGNKLIQEYNWPGNIRELKNFVQNISVLEKEKNIDYQTVSKYLPKNDNNFHLVKSKNEDNDLNEREILYKVLFDMKRDLNHLKKVTDEIILKSENSNSIHNEKILNVGEIEKKESSSNSIENTLSLFDNEKNLIIRALKKNFGKRKNAAKDLGISERTLYRKIKEFNL
jgi:transcriptional regulator with PAS, ATPase and Fis domain